MWKTDTQTLDSVVKTSLESLRIKPPYQISLFIVQELMSTIPFLSLLMEALLFWERIPQILNPVHLTPWKCKLANSSFPLWLFPSLVVLCSILSVQQYFEFSLLLTWKLLYHFLFFTWKSIRNLILFLSIFVTKKWSFDW